MNFFRNNRFLSPDPLEGGNGGGAGGANASNGAPASTFDPEKYVPIEKFQEIENRLGELDNRYRTVETRLPKPRESRSDEPSAPDLSKYDFTNDPSAFTRFLDDRDKYREHQSRKTRETEQNERRQQEEPIRAVRETMETFRKAEREYRKANPSYDQDIKKIGRDVLPDEAKLALMGRKDPRIAHEIAKDPELLAQVQDAYEEDGVAGVIEVCGIVKARIKAQAAEAKKGEETAAWRRPPASSVPGSSGAKPKPTLEQRFARFQG